MGKEKKEGKRGAVPATGSGRKNAWMRWMMRQCLLSALTAGTPWVAASSAPCVLPDKNCLPPSSLVYTYPFLSVTCE